MIFSLGLLTTLITANTYSSSSVAESASGCTLIMRQELLNDVQEKDSQGVEEILTQNLQNLSAASKIPAIFLRLPEAYLQKRAELKNIELKVRARINASGEGSKRRALLLMEMNLQAFQRKLDRSPNHPELLKELEQIILTSAVHHYLRENPRLGIQTDVLPYLFARPNPLDPEHIEHAIKIRDSRLKDWRVSVEVRKKDERQSSSYIEIEFIRAKAENRHGYNP